MAQNAQPKMDWSNAGYHTFPAYHLTVETVNDFLRTVFGNYNFFTVYQMDHYKFWIPRALTEAERAKLRERRWVEPES
ncbi:hypothetical protein V8E51_014630 [Hyaloscypha variabilis]